MFGGSSLFWLTFIGLKSFVSKYTSLLLVVICLWELVFLNVHIVLRELFVGQ